MLRKVGLLATLATARLISDGADAVANLLLDDLRRCCLAIMGIKRAYCYCDMKLASWCYCSYHCIASGGRRSSSRVVIV